MTHRLSDNTRTNARQLRREMTDAEARIWYTLRGQGLEGYKFRRQHPFGSYILDFYCPEAKLAIELDGGQHFEEAQRDRDQERAVYLASKGLRVLRFTNLEALSETDEVLNAIHEALKSPG